MKTYLGLGAAALLSSTQAKTHHKYSNGSDENLRVSTIPHFSGYGEIKNVQDNNDYKMTSLVTPWIYRSLQVNDPNLRYSSIYDEHNVQGLSSSNRRPDEYIFGSPPDLNVQYQKRGGCDFCDKMDQLKVQAQEQEAATIVKPWNSYFFPDMLRTKKIQSHIDKLNSEKLDVQPKKVYRSRSEYPKVQALCKTENGSWGPCANDSSFSRISDDFPKVQLKCIQSDGSWGSCGNSAMKNNYLKDHPLTITNQEPEKKIDLHNPYANSWYFSKPTSQNPQVESPYYDYVPHVESPHNFRSTEYNPHVELDYYNNDQVSLEPDNVETPMLLTGNFRYKHRKSQEQPNIQKPLLGMPIDNKQLDKFESKHKQEKIQEMIEKQDSDLFNKKFQDHIQKKQNEIENHHHSNAKSTGSVKIENYDA
ncbi:UNKNOWN [Stylonychia lemnae]|uniref:Uncharacterized protein n=1 Tax=Stylonychia lemnae TaxID=5949 RepID=A0A078B6Y3_STYLE|nr:UNKNOWN [Stylonychia lemnae]|eukprot:CDW89062.1 UNKNOWN [Stylonychia lemnae]